MQSTSSGTTGRFGHLPWILTVWVGAYLSQGSFPSVVQETPSAADGSPRFRKELPFSPRPTPLTSPVNSMTLSLYLAAAISLALLNSMTKSAARRETSGLSGTADGGAVPELV